MIFVGGELYSPSYQSADLRCLKINVLIYAGYYYSGNVDLIKIYAKLSIY